MLVFERERIMHEHEHKQLVKELAVPGEQLFARWSPEHCFASHMILGLVGEILELDQAYLIHDEYAPEVVEELGDIEFFLAGLYQIYKIQPPAASQSPLKSSSITNLKDAAEALATQVKRYIYYNKIDALVEQTLHKFTHTLQEFYYMHGIDRDDVLTANITKLRLRYGKRYSDAAAATRRDKNPDA